MYSIEVLFTLNTLESPIRKAMESLNEVQGDFQEFNFYFPSPNLMAEARLIRREKYLTSDLFNWLEEYRITAKGSKPFLILIVDGPLSSQNLSNLFGAHEADKGLAVFTTFSSGRFVHDIVRFVRYYLVRYALSFVAPSLKSHQDTRSCFFDKKIYKPDILRSLNTGSLCDECLSKLTPVWTSDIKLKFEQMAQLVSNDLPHALIMKGGGVKGLTFAGAVTELEKYYSFDTYAGTSAGAIAALLFASNYSPQELQQELYSMDFSTFKDASIPKAIWNFIVKRGFYPGNTIEEWLSHLVKRKLDKTLIEVLMKDLPNRAIFYASSPVLGTVVFDSLYERQDEIATFAVRCSMSIPYFFIAPTLSGSRILDGGVRNNFPLNIFLDANKGKPAIALYLLPPPPSRRRWWVIKDLIDVNVTGDEPAVLREHPEKIVSIDTYPIRTTDFDLSQVDKDFLIAVGKAAALRFVHNRDHSLVKKSDIESVENEVRDLHAAVCKKRGLNHRLNWR